MNGRQKLFSGAALAVAVGLCLAPWPFSGAALREEISRQASHISDLQAEARGNAIFALLPRPRIKIAEFRAHDASGALNIEADYLRGDLRLLPLIAGRIELSNVTLVEPRIDIDLDKAGENLRTAAARPRSGDALARTLGAIGLIDGHATLRRNNGQWLSEITGIDLTIDMSERAAPVSARGSFIWRSQPVQTALWIGQPASDGRSPVLASFDCALLNASVDGAIAAAAPPEFEGAARLTAPAIDGLAAMFGVDLSGPQDFGALSVNSTVKLNARGLTLSRARVALGGSRFDGSLTAFMHNDRPQIDGTLAAEKIDLTALASLAPATFTPEGEWSRTPLNIDRLMGADVDLRLSAKQIRLGRFDIANAGISIIGNPDRLNISIAEAEAYRGQVRGHVTAYRNAAKIGWHSAFSIANLDMTSFFTAVRIPKRFSGAANGEIALDGEGQAIADVLASLHGAAHIEAASGDVIGIDMEQALRRIERRPLSIASELRGGATHFDHANASVEIEHGVARIQRAEGVGAGVSFDASGSIAIPARALALHVRAWSVQGDGDAATDRTQLKMDISGAWNAPSLVLDTQSLIQHSKAAAPLWSEATQAAPAAAPSADLRQSP